MIEQASHQQVERYLAAFEAVAESGFAIDPLWVNALRREAIQRFANLGFPTARRGNEEWKYTNVAPIATTPFHPPAAGAPVSVSEGDMEPFTFGGSRWNRLVFVDGVYVEALSALPDLPHEAHVLNLREAVVTMAGLTEDHLGRHAEFEHHSFAALNTAFFYDGAFVYIPDGAHVGTPIHLLFLSTGQQDSTTNPRVLLLTGKNSQATIVESYESLADERYFTNAVTEAVLGEGSVVRYYKLQRQSEQAYHVTTTQIALGRDSNLSSVNIDLGGGLVRNNLNVVTEGEGSFCRLNGAYLITRAQHVDNQVIVDHASPYTGSRELYKGVLDGRSRSVFHGSIIVREGARKVDAHQEDKNLLLSDQAEADTKPAFWIYCDDVKCGHGAACGQIDENAFFYLRSRGLGEKEARALLTRAFVAEVLESIEDEAVRVHVDALAMAKLQAMVDEA